jgi:transposase-like protein
MITWTEDMKETVTKLRSGGANTYEIAAKIGVDPETFLEFRKRTGFPIAPIKRSGNRLVGRHDE